MKKIILMLVLMVSITSFGNEAFGFREGMSLTEIKEKFGSDKVSSIGNDIYQVELNNRLVEIAYAVMYEGKMCKLKVHTHVEITNIYGDSLKEKYQKFHDNISSKYGTAEDLNFLRSGSIWKEPEDYTMSLLKEERVLNSYWNKEDMSVLLTVTMYSKEKFDLGVGYEFKDFKKYVEAKKKEEESQF